MDQIGSWKKGFLYREDENMVQESPMGIFVMTGKMKLCLSTIQVLLPILLFFSSVNKLLSQSAELQQDPVHRSGDDTEVRYTGIPVFAFDSDTGVQVGGFILATVYDKKSKPYRTQYYAGLYRSNLGMEMYELALDRLNVDGDGLRLRANVAYYRMLNEPFYGYGSEIDVSRQKAIENGQTQVSTNLQENRSIFLFEEFSINEAFFRGDMENGVGPGKRHLRESQNKYFTYDLIVPYSRFLLENSIDWTPFKWQLGTIAKLYRIQSYEGDYENNNTVANTPTLIDLSQPEGYDATQSAKPVIGFAAGFMIDTRNPQREKNPDHGIFSDLHIEAFDRAFGSAYSFYRITLTHRQYFSMFRTFFSPLDQELVFAYRFMVQKNTGAVPFFEAGEITTSSETLSGLGGSAGLRGFSSYQFIGPVMSLASYEFRYTLLRTDWLGGMDYMVAIFQDSGKVSESLQQLGTSDLHHSPGASLRLIWKKDTVLNFTYGKSRYDEHFSMVFNHAF